MSDTFAFGDFRLDVARARVTHGGTNVPLTTKSIAVLELLARRAPATVSRGEFEAHVWPEGYIEAANLTQTIYMIRTSLARYCPDPIIETHHKRGYRFAKRVYRTTAAAVLDLHDHGNDNRLAAGLLVHGF